MVGSAPGGLLIGLGAGLVGGVVRLIQRLNKEEERAARERRGGRPGGGGGSGGGGV